MVLGQPLPQILEMLNRLFRVMVARGKTSYAHLPPFLISYLALLAGTSDFSDDEMHNDG